MSMATISRCLAALAHNMAAVDAESKVVISFNGSALGLVKHLSAPPSPRHVMPGKYGWPALPVPRAARDEYIRTL